MKQILVFFLLACAGIPVFSQTVLCPGDSLTLNLSGHHGSVQWEESANGSTWSSISGQTSTSLVLLPVVETWYRARVTDGTCNPVYSDTTHVLVSGLTVSAGPDTAVCLGDSVQIGGTPTASGGISPYTYAWSPANAISSVSVSNPKVAPMVPAQYILTVTDAGGCAMSDTVQVDTNGVAQAGSITFNYTGSMQTFTVPPCVYSITIEAYGAQGGNLTAYGLHQGGKGAKMVGTFAVNPGQVLNVIVGKQGNPDPSSSGGGGGSGVALGNTPWIIAGGGGGVDFQNNTYAGMAGVTTNNGVAGSGAGGAGGTAGGNGGDYSYNANHISRGGNGWNAGASGTIGTNGSAISTTFTNGVFGLGGGGGSVGYGFCNCGGGGGGYSGGGSGYANQSGGGGGSYNIGTNQNNAGGNNSGDGKIIINW